MACRVTELSSPLSKLSLAIHEKTVAIIPRIKLQKSKLRMEQARQSLGCTWFTAGSKQEV